MSVLDTNIIKITEFVGVLRVRGARIGLAINVKKTKSLIRGISEGEDIMLGNKKVDRTEK